MKNTSVLILLLSSFSIISSCSDQTDNKTTEKSEQLTPTSKKVESAPGIRTETQPAVDPYANLNLPVNLTTYPVANQNLNSGIAANVINSGGYTYIEIIDQGKSTWLAGSQTAVKRGQQVYWGESAAMRNFTSKSLNRTFSEILFVSKFIVPQEATKKQVTVHTSTGKVLSSQNAGNYSFIEVSTNNGNIWIAAPETTIKVNDNVSWTGSSKMSNFTSKSLNKTFAEILFVNSVNVQN